MKQPDTEGTRRTPNRSPRTLALAIGIALLVAALPAVARSLPPPRLRIIVDTPVSGQTFHAQVYIASGRPIGAYTLDLLFDPKSVQLERIDAGTTAGFNHAPFTNKQDFGSGHARFASFQAQSLSAPTGKIHVADITLKALQTSKSLRLKLNAITVADTAGRRYRVPKRTKIVRFRLR